MVEKQLLNAIFARIRHGALTIRYWDGTSVTYGEGTAEVVISFKSAKAVRAVLRNMTLGFGEGYMNGLIDIEGPLDHVIKIADENTRELRKLELTKYTHLPTRNIRSKQKRQIQHHYDLGNDFYKLWLDESMTYSCAYFKTPKMSLENAQDAKRQHVLRKLQLKKGQRVLDIGSGWGSLLLTAARDYGITGLGVTLSEEQLKHAKAEAKRLGLDKQVTFELINYQDLPARGEQFDRVVSVGMFEHVGKNNQPRYFTAVERLLADGGVSLLHTICVPSSSTIDPWIDKYIFPGGYLPSLSSIAHSLADNGFDLLDFENLRLHYAMTLDEWWRRFESHKDEIIKMYDERFYRMWRLYLTSSSGSFRYGSLKLGQFVFTKGTNNNLPLTRDYLYD